MKKELHIAIIAFVCLMAAFIISVVISEEKNLYNLRTEYQTPVQTSSTDSVTIPAPSEKAIAYQKNKVLVWIIRLVLSMAIPAFFLFSGLSLGLRNWIMARVGRIIAALIIYFIIYSLIDFLINLPIDYYSGFISKHAYGLSTQTLGKWMGDYLKGFAINTAISAAVIWVPFMMISKSPNYWWLYLGLLSIPVLIFMLYVSPIYIDPIFNKYVAVQDKELEAEIQEELSRTTIGNCDVFQVDKSVDTKEMNAFMTGVFNTKRIVLWDTTIKNFSVRETLAVVAHEMGHYLMGHVWKSTVLGGLLSIFFFYFVNKAALWVISKSGGSFGFNRLADIAAFPLIILMINIFMFLATPVENVYSRYIENEADRFELELTQDNNAVATSTVKLHEGSLVLPKPGLVYTLWNYDHPTFKDRVDFANTYKPWEEGKPIKYQKFIVR